MSNTVVLVRRADGHFQYIEKYPMETIAGTPNRVDESRFMSAFLSICCNCFIIGQMGGQLDDQDFNNVV